MVMPEHLYTGYRIRLLSQLQKGVWYPEAVILKDVGAASIGTPIYDKHAYLLKADADLQALKMAKRWVNKQKT
jgi:hypothetical protein